MISGRRSQRRCDWVSLLWVTATMTHLNDAEPSGHTLPADLDRPCGYAFPEHGIVAAACEDFGTTIDQAKGGNALFLERYSAPSPSGLRIVRPGQLLMVARGLYALFSERPVDRVGWSQFPELAHALGGALTYGQCKRIAAWRPAESRPRIAPRARLTVPVSEAARSPGRHVRFDLEGLHVAELMAPAHAGNMRGGPGGVRVLRAAIAFRVYQRARQAHLERAGQKAVEPPPPPSPSPLRE